MSQVSGDAVADDDSRGTDGARRGIASRVEHDPTPVIVARLPALVRAHRWYFVGAIALASVLALLFVALVPPKYVAHAYIASNQGADIDAPLGQLQQLAGLFGGSLMPGAAALGEFTTVMQSRSTAQKLVQETDVLQHLFADRWEERTRSWKPAPGFLALMRRFVYEKVLRIDLPEPGADLLVRHVDEKLKFIPSKSNPGLIEIRYESRDPEFALLFLRSVMRAAESTLLQRYKELNDASLKYAMRELERSHPVEVREALGSLMIKELRRAIVLSSGHLDTLRVVVLPEVSYIPRRPSLVVSLLLFNLVGVLLLLAILMVRAGLHRGRAS